MSPNIGLMFRLIALVAIISAALMIMTEAQEGEEETTADPTTIGSETTVAETAVITTVVDAVTTVTDEPTTTTDIYQSRCVASTRNRIPASLTVGLLKPCLLGVEGACGSAGFCATISVAFASILQQNITYCKMGLCLPSTNGSEEAYQTRYGQTCTKDSDCYTGYCDPTDSVCSCASCAQFATGWSFGNSTLAYHETCIPKATLTRAVGQTCDSLHYDPPSKICDATSLCFKCPEYWNNTNVESTCKEIKFPTQNSSSSCSCGYLASCNVVGTLEICTCHSGYQLHTNGKDCYGWKTVSLGSCSVTCGSGTQSVKQTCDAPDALTSPCLESTKLSTIACEAGRCPFDADAQKYAIDLSFKSSALTVSLFQTIVAPALQSGVATAMNTKCRDESATFLSCCPGKSWSTGLAGSYMFASQVALLNPFTDGTTFSLGLMLKPNTSNDLCNGAGSRKKRDALSFVAIPQSSLLTIVQSPALVSAINVAVQQGDPTASVLTSDFGLATTTTTTTTTTAAATVWLGRSLDDIIHDSSWIQFGTTWVKSWVFVVGIVGVIVVIVILVISCWLICCKKDLKRITSAKVCPETQEGEEMESRRPSARVDPQQTQQFQQQLETPAPNATKEPKRKRGDNAELQQVSGKLLYNKPQNAAALQPYQPYGYGTEKAADRPTNSNKAPSKPKKRA